MANMLITELYNIVLASGITPSGSDWSQVFQALLCGGTFQDVGVVNAMRTTLPNIVNQPNASSVFNNLRIGTRVKVIVANTNTSPTVTLNALNLGAINVIRPDGNALFPGDLPSGQIIEFVYDGTHWRGLGMLNILPSPPPAGLTVYVRTDGNDSNNGMTNTPSGAFATIAGAITSVSNQYALAPDKTVTVIMGIAGTYTGNFDIPSGSSFFVEGLTNAPASYVISGGTVPNVDVVSAAKASSLTLLQCTVQNISNTRNWSNAENGAVVTFDNVNFSQTAASSPTAVMQALAGGSIICLNVTFTGINCGAYFAATGAGANILISSDGISTAHWSGTNVATTATAVAADTGTIQVGAWTPTGTVTGTRHVAQYNGVIDSGGQGVNIFPGTVTGIPGSGTSNLGGWFIA